MRPGGARLRPRLRRRLRRRRGRAERTCGPAPAQACDVVGVAAQWWRIYFDLDNRSLDAAFKARLNAVMAAGERWVTREPERAEAWFYLGAAYGVRAQYNGQRSEFLAAARDGKRIKNSLEKALALEPRPRRRQRRPGPVSVLRRCRAVGPEGASLVPRAAGRRQGEGLAQLRRARERGVLLRSEAALPAPPRRSLVREQERRGGRDPRRPARAPPPQPDLPVEHRAGARGVQERPGCGPRVYQSLVDGARGGSLGEPLLAEMWGRLGAAAQLLALAEADRAIDELRAVVARRPRAPYGAVAQAQLDLGHALDQIGSRDQAVAAYRAALAAVPAGDPRNVRRAANQGLSRAPDRVTGRRRAPLARGLARVRTRGCGRRDRVTRRRGAAQAWGWRAPVPPGPRPRGDRNARARRPTSTARCRRAPCRRRPSSPRATTSWARSSRPRPIARAPWRCTTPRCAHTARPRRREALRSGPARASADPVSAAGDPRARRHDRNTRGSSPGEIAPTCNFLLDFVLFSSIIYSLYEPGSLSPELVIVRRR